MTLPSRTDYLAYQKLLDRIQGMAWLMDETGKIYCNNVDWQNYTGQKSSSSRSLFLWDVISPKDKLKLDIGLNTWSGQVKLKNAEDCHNLFDLQIEQLTSDRNLSLLLCTATLIPGLVAEMSVIKPNSTEIADYKLKELALMAKTDFIRRIIDSSKDCIKVLDLEGRLLYMNDGGQDIMEIDNFDEQVQYAPWLSFWQDCDFINAKKAFAAACAGKVGKFDGYCPTAKGTPKWWEVVVTPIFDEYNRVQEILSVSRDITERKMAEEALKERNQELDRFTYTVTHDLKAPLRGVFNLSAMIIEDLHEQIPPENKHQLDLLQKRVLRMSALIDSLLKYSLVGKEKTSIESIDLNQLLPDIIDSLSPPKNFTISIPSSLPKLNGNTVLLHQVFTNLISNAIKHHDRDTGNINLTFKDYSNHYEFAIADDGPGIPESERDRIFKIFETVKNKTSTTNTGIGLALVEKIVRGEGGKLWLDSSLKKGSIFYFTWKK